MPAGRPGVPRKGNIPAPAKPARIRSKGRYYVVQVELAPLTKTEAFDTLEKLEPDRRDKYKLLYAREYQYERTVQYKLKEA